jgi:hypothetical protein
MDMWGPGHASLSREVDRTPSRPATPQYITIMNSRNPIGESRIPHPQSPWASTRDPAEAVPHARSTEATARRSTTPEAVADAAAA